MWITQERYPQAHSHNNTNMLLQHEKGETSGREAQLANRLKWSRQWGPLQDTPSLMLRFKDPPNDKTVAEHNAVFNARGSVLWGLWLKEFEEQASIAKLLSSETWPKPVYFADTT